MNRYFDLTRLRGCVGVLLDPGQTAVFTGTQIHWEDPRYEGCELALRLERENDLYFWFGQAPRVGVYTVPKMELGGYDSRGGYFAGSPDFTLGEEPLYYIDRKRQCWRIAEHSRDFAAMGMSWRETMVPAEGFRVFGSLQEAQREYPIAQPRDERELLEMIREMEEGQ